MSSDKGLQSDLTAAILKGADLRSITGHDCLDSEIYTWFAVLYRQFIQSWYVQINGDGPLAQDAIEPLQELVDGIQRRVIANDAAIAIQDIFRILDIHFSDLDVASERAKTSRLSIEALYLALNPHPALDVTDNPLALEQYFSDFARVLIQELLPDLPRAAQSLLSALIQQVILVVLNTLTEPWMVHDLIIKALGPKSTPDADKPQPSSRRSSRRDRTDQGIEVTTPRRTRRKLDQIDLPLPEPPAKKQKRTRWQTITELLAPTPQDTNPFILWFVQHRVFQGPLANFVFAALWPVHSLISIYSNRVLRNAISIYLSADNLAASLEKLREAIFPNGRLGPARVRPSDDEQVELRRQAGLLLPRAFGRPIVAISAFDSKTVNMRLLISTLDYVMRAFMDSPDTKCTN